MDWEKAGISCLGLIALLAILIVVSAFLISWAWGWVVPDVFSGAVAQGILPASLTLWQAFKLSILFTILGVTGRGSSSSSSSKS
jgi:hypothetical protein